MCYTDLRPAPVRAPVAAPALVPAGGGKHARQDTSHEQGAPGTERAMSTEAMLALLAAESAPPLGRLAGRFDTTGSRVGLMAGGIVAVSAALFLVMAVVGSLL